MNESVAIFQSIIFIVLIVFIIDYLKNHCPKCKIWHPFRFSLIILDKPSEKQGKEYVKCRKCDHEWEKIKKQDGFFDSGGE